MVGVECIGRRSPANELRARVGAARRIAELEGALRIAELEGSLRIALIEKRKLSTTDDLTRVASRRFFSQLFPARSSAPRVTWSAVADPVR